MKKQMKNLLGILLIGAVGMTSCSKEDPIEEDPTDNSMSTENHIYAECRLDAIEFLNLSGLTSSDANITATLKKQGAVYGSINKTFNSSDLPKHCISNTSTLITDLESTYVLEVYLEGTLVSTFDIVPSDKSPEYNPNDPGGIISRFELFDGSNLALKITMTYYG